MGNNHNYKNSMLEKDKPDEVIKLFHVVVLFL